MSFVFKRLALVLAFFLLALLAACNLPNQDNASETAAAVITEVAAELEQQLTQTAQVTPPASNTPAPTATDTLVPATDTPEPTITPSVPMVSVSVNTNCRSGPAVYYDLVGALLVNEQAQVIARNSATGYWIIHNPDRDGDCWLYPQYADVQGDISDLPERAIPPTPTPTVTLTPTVTVTPAAPDFELAYENVHDCSGTSYLTVKATNIGNQSFESAEILVEDIDAATILYGPDSTDTPFLADPNGCPPAASSLGAGNSAYVAVPLGSPLPSGDTTRFTLVLCTADGLGGECVTDAVEFTLP